MALYKNVLHHSGNKVPKWLLETVGVYVSLLNGCAYCVAHHFAGLSRLLQDDTRAREIRTALETEVFEGAFAPRERAILGYARQLTHSPAEISETSIQAMRAAGLDDGEILEVNQVASYFAYVNRTVLGLGVTTRATRWAFRRMIPLIRRTGSTRKVSLPAKSGRESTSCVACIR